MPVLTHPVRLSDISSAPAQVVGLYYLNAFYCATCGPNARGAIVFGEGAPRGFVGPNIEVKAFSAAFDVVAHELTHGVVANSARLTSSLEAGSLNEGFADIFGVSTTFFFQPTGDGPMQASYLLGKDLTVPSGLIFSRLLRNPAETANPDHYSRRGIEVHFNSTILGHAFYLAIEVEPTAPPGWRWKVSDLGIGIRSKKRSERLRCCCRPAQTSE